MKLYSALLLIGSSRAASVKCMASDAPDAPIQMTATITNSEVQSDLTQDNEWSCTESANKENAVCTRTWNVDQFGSEGEMKFEDDALVLRKTIAAKCKAEKVDGVTVCLKKGHNLEFKCRYPLKTTTVANTVNIHGYDTNVSGDGEGKLNYKLTVVDENVDIGETIQVEIEAINKNLVWHAIQDCQVSKDGYSVSILDWQAGEKNLVSFCPNVLGAAVETKSSTDTTKFSWKAFKWSTSIPYQTEKQTITCTISLSEKEPVVYTPGCDDSFEHQSDVQSSNSENGSNAQSPEGCQTLGLDKPGSDYKGDMSRTASGKRCIKWSDRWHDDPNAWDHNYCRNPTGEDGGVWCYVEDLNLEWEYCSQIPACDDKCQNPHPNHLGWDYTGDESKTVSGLKCQKWNTWYPHQPTNYDWEPNWDHNYCRNPDFSEGGVWCYTTDPNTRREYCSQVDSCGETCQDRSSKGRNYQGTQSKTRTGIKCQKWNEDKPHHHSKPAVDHNYCRNPDSDDGGVWCFTTDPNVNWEYCDVEEC